MLQLFSHSIIRQIQRNKAVTLLLVLGITISMFCISTTQGVAQRFYGYISSWTEYSTITVDLNGKNIKQFPDWLTSHYGEEIVNTLYLTKTDDNAVVIGWQGTEAGRWFPITSGRFFAQEEKCENLIVLSEREQSKTLEREVVNICGVDMRIIGIGDFIPFHFSLGISPNSKQSLFDVQDCNIYIIPYETFLELYRPQQIVVQFAGLNQQLTNTRIPEIQEYLGNDSVYPPLKASDYALTEEQLRRALESMVLCLLAGVTIIQLMEQWLAFIRREIYVYRLCGMKQIRCILFVYAQWLLILVLSALLALGIHALCLPVLSYFDADILPNITMYTLLAAVVFTLSVAFTFRKVRGVCDLSRKGASK